MGAPHSCAMRRAWNPEPRAVLSIRAPLSCTQPQHPGLYSNLREADILSSFCRRKKQCQGYRRVSRGHTAKKGKMGARQLGPLLSAQAPPGKPPPPKWKGFQTVHIPPNLSSKLRTSTRYFRQGHSVSLSQLRAAHFSTESAPDHSTSDLG